MNEKKDCLALAVWLAAEMLRCGGETYRAEECCLNILHTYGAEDISVIALPTALLVSAEIDGVHRTESASIKLRGTDLRGIERINRVSRRVSSGVISVEEGFAEAGEHGREIPFFLLCLFGSLSAGCFSVIFGGGFVDFIPAFLAAVVAQCFKRLVDKVSHYSFFSTMGGCMITTAFARMAVQLCANCNQDAIIIGGIMSMLPGLAITNALRDTIHGDLVSGVARGV